jgi:hypothetical protein
MAYNPQITDQSGMFLAQGRLAGGMAALGGISQGIQTYQKNRLQNQVLSNENDSLIAGLQQLQQMGGGATMSNLAPAGMEKLIQKHLEGGGLNLSDSMKLNSMLNTTLKTAQVGQQMQAQQMQAQVNQQRLMNEIATGRQAQADVTGIGSVLRELSGQELTPERFTAAAAKANLSPAAIESLTQSLGRLQPKAPARPTGEEALVQSQLAAWQAANPGLPVTPQVEAEIRAQARRAGAATTTIKTGDDVSEKLVAERLFQDRDTAVAAQRALPAYDEAEKLLKGGKVMTGTLAEGRLAIAKALAPFGVDQTTADNTEVLRAQLAAPVLSLVKQLGSGAGISNADRDFAERAAGGKITLNPQAILRLAEIGRRASNLAITNYKKRLDRVYPEGEEGSSRLRRSLVLEDMAPAEAEVATPAPMEQPAPQAAQAPQFKLGDRVRQGGVTYEWNGTTMVPIR